MTNPKKGDIRQKDGCIVRCMACGEGYVMYCMKSCYPQVMPVIQWNQLKELPQQMRMAA